MRPVLLLVMTLSACAALDGRRYPVDGIGDSWVGGFGPLADAGTFLAVDFQRGISRLHPEPGRAPLGIIHPSRSTEAVSFAIDDGVHRFKLALRFEGGDELAGTVTEPGGRIARAELHRVGPGDPPSGTFAVDGGLLFSDEGTLFDTRDGTERRLLLSPGGLVRAGSGVATLYPLHGPFAPGPQLSIRREELRFESGGVWLKGMLLMPPGPGPHPAVVNVHGSGRLTRNDHWANLMARVLLSEGWAVFLYDKRGVGDSEGEYVGRGAKDTNNVSAENLERLAGDAAAAVELLSHRSDIDAARLGLFGLSQAGWIIPLAAKRSSAVRLMVIASGPAVQTSVELAFSALAGDGASCLPIDQADRVAAECGPKTGFDPVPVIGALSIPGLWIYGANDSSIPVRASMAALETLRPRHDFEVKRVVGAGHELYRVERDTEAERLTSPGLAPEALDAIRAWLLRH